MEFSAHQIAEMLGGTVEGNPEATVNTLAKIEEGKPKSLSFLGNPKYTQYIYKTDATIVIVSKDFKAEEPIKDTCTLIRVENAHASFGKLLEAYNQIKNNKVGIDKQTAIADSAKLGENLYIGAFTAIGDNVILGDNVKIYPGSYIGDNVKVGANTTIFADVKVYSDCVIGANCMIHAGVVIGADGFGFAPNSENQYNKVPQIGNVILEDYVEVGANTSIDRATLGSTIIRKGVKLDNLIQIAHNVEIGENTVIAAQTGVAGSTKIGKNCMIGGQVGFAGHITIGENVKIAAQSGVGNNVKDNEIVQGSPAFSIGDYKRSYVMFRNLPQMSTDLRQLKSEISELKK
jgi:UDP-3-O-[3-hydroxymyristoyl] glucosamine N-acyltransferase